MHSLRLILAFTSVHELVFPRVTIYTMAGQRCGPAGLGEVVDDGNGAIVDTRLMVPGKFTPAEILAMNMWCRFATQEEMELDGKWYRRLQTPKAIVIGQRTESRVAPHHFPIGASANCATALAQSPTPFWQDVPVDGQLLECVPAPPTPRSSHSEE